MTTPGVAWTVDQGQAFAAMGYFAGIADTVNTNIYINAVVERAYSLLSEFFELWMDQRAKERPNEFMHVYHWPQRFGNYEETVGNPLDRLWMMKLTGSGRNREATFEFIPEDRPSPVNPILTAQGVKEGVHVFVHKATAMEYGAAIEVTPKLAQFLAYVADGNAKGQGHDEAQTGVTRHARGNVMFSKGPVRFQAGGDVTYMKFTTAFLEWWSTLAQSHYDHDIKPGLEKDLAATARKYGTVKVGKNTTSKAMSVDSNIATYEAARAKAIADMEAQATDYIRSAAARRAKLV